MEYKKEYNVYYNIIFSKLKYLTIHNIHYHDLYELYYIVQKHKIKDLFILRVNILKLQYYSINNLCLKKSDKIRHDIFLINNEIFRNYVEFLNNINNFNIFLYLRYKKNTKYDSIYESNENDKIENLSIIIDMDYYSNIRPQLTICSNNIIRLKFVNLRDFNSDFYTVIIENIYIPNVNMIFFHNFHLNINEIHNFLNKLSGAYIIYISKCILKEKIDECNTTIKFLVIYGVSFDKLIYFLDYFKNLEAIHIKPSLEDVDEMLKFDPKNIYCIDSVIFDPSHIINEDGIDKLYRGIKNVFRSRVGIYNENIVNYSTKK